MNPKDIAEICSIFKLGTPFTVPQRVYGGLLHKMWRVDTEKASYAIKELSKSTHLRSNDAIENYDLTEHIAYSFSYNKIPALCALEINGKCFTMIGRKGYLVYPWLNAKILEKGFISEPHAITIAEILARMHLINLSVPKIKMSDPEIHKQGKILKLIIMAQEYCLPFAKVLFENYDLLLKVNDSYKNAIPVLRDHTVVSHGDLNQKNVLWDQQGNPILIDWESARKWNPTHDIIGTSLDWSGINTDFVPEIFFKMLENYKKTGGCINEHHVEAAFDRTTGEWMNWMIYNVERACKHPKLEIKNLGIDQVYEALKTIMTLKKFTPQLIENFKQVI